jgi:hypothetical protein
MGLMQRSDHFVIAAQLLCNRWLIATELLNNRTSFPVSRDHRAITSQALLNRFLMLAK